MVPEHRRPPDFPTDAGPPPGFKFSRRLLNLLPEVHVVALDSQFDDLRYIGRKFMAWSLYAPRPGSGIDGRHEYTESRSCSPRGT